MSLLALKEKYIHPVRHIFKKKQPLMKHSATNESHHILPFLLSLIQKAYRHNDLQIFLFTPDGAVTPTYYDFITLLSDADKKNLDIILSDVLSTGRHFQTELILNNNNSVCLYGFSVGTGYLLFQYPIAHCVTLLSEYKQKHTALCQKIDDLKSYCNILPIPFWIRDNKQNIIFSNDAFTHLSGYEQTEIIPLAKAHFLAQSAIIRGTTEYLTTPISHQGNRYDYHIFETPFKNDDDLQYTLGYALDISKECALKKSLHQAQNAQYDILNLLSVPALLCDEQRNIIHYNQAFLDIWDITDTDIKSLPNHPALLEYLQIKRKLPEYRDIKSWRNEQFTPYYDKDYIYKNMWHLPDGRILNVISAACHGGGVVSLYKDTTHQLHLERDYQNSLQNIQETLNSLEEAIGVFDSKCQLTVFNQGLNELTDKRLYKNMHLSYLPEFLNHLPELKNFTQNIALNSAFAFPVQGFSDTVVQNEKTYFLKSIRLESGDILITFRDVTAQVNYQNILTDKAETLSELTYIREMFFRQISFRLREPMTVISGFAEILQQQIFGTLNAKQSEYISDIRHSSNQMLTLIDNLMDLVSLESDFETLKLQFKPHKIDKIIHSVLQDIRGDCTDMMLNISYHISNHDAMIMGDYTSLRQALLQILYNAIKASEKNNIDTRRIILSYYHDDTYHYMTIQDYGTGIKDHILQSISDNSIKNKELRGYGLRYAKRVCVLHGGDLYFDTQQGTKVTLKIPISQE